MTSISALVGAIALVALFLFFILSRRYRRKAETPDWERMEFQASQVALLFSYQEQQVLRAKLHRSVFKRIQRKRMRLGYRYASHLRSDLMHFVNLLGAMEEDRQLARDAQSLNLLLLGIQYKAALAFLFPSEPLRDYRFATRWADLSRAVTGSREELRKAVPFA